MQLPYISSINILYIKMLLISEKVRRYSSRIGDDSVAVSIEKGILNFKMIELNHLIKSLRVKEIYKIYRYSFIM